MRILFVIPALSAVYGGPSKVAVECVAAMARRGMAVDLITTNANGSDNLEIACPDSWLEKSEGYRLRYFRRLGRTEYKFSTALVAWLWRRVRDYDAVLISSNFNFPVLATALACRASRVPYLITPHGMLEPWALAYKARKKKLYYRCVERPLVLRGASAIQALNRNEAENIRKLELGPPVVTLPNGVDRHEAEAVADSDKEAFLSRFPQARDKTLILFLHRIDPKKGLDLLAQAFAKIQARFPRAHVVVAGPDNIGFAGVARGFFATAGVSDDAFTFTGMLEGPAKHGAFAASSVFVLPSYSEGFSMAVLEAMAAGLPCVITTACNFPEAGEAGVAKVVPAESVAFADALEELLASPTEAVEMGRRARELILKDYTWNSIAERLVKLLETMVVRPQDA